MKHAAASQKLAQAAQSYLDELDKMAKLNPKTLESYDQIEESKKKEWQDSARQAALADFNKKEDPFIMGKEKTSQEDAQPSRWWCSAL